jgi:uncharacterized protein (TIGR03083 family)
MDFPRFLDCLAADYERLRAVAPGAFDQPVPTCPGWSVADQTRHLGEVYLHKVGAMREGVEPEQWPPPGTEQEEPLALLERAYAELRGEFAARRPEDPAGSWYGPDQTVGFWIRRMAQETVFHRIDAVLGAGQAVAPVPDDLALDGIDELLKVFVSFGVAEWGAYFTDILGGSPGRSYTIRADGTAWSVRTGPGEFTVRDGADEGADVTVSGPPTAVLRWVWNREGADDAGAVAVEGPPDAVAELKRCIATGTQ